MARMKVRHVIHKPSGWYWNPSKSARALGFRPEALGKDEAGALIRAQALNLRLDEERTRDIPPSLREGSVSSLASLYRSDPSYTELARTTKRSYEQALSAIEKWCGDIQVSEISRKDIRGWYRKMYATTPAQANARMRILRLLLAHGIEEGIIATNPAARMKLEGRPPRQVIWTPGALKAFCDAAAARGRPSLALAARLAMDTGQRQGDVLRLTWAQYDGCSIELRQGKTGATVRVAVTAELKAALDATPRTGVQMVISEATNRPYREDHFRHEFAATSDAAGTREFWFLDFRRTAVVHMARAGATLPEITAVTGHTVASAKQIIETYLPRDAEMAKAGVAKLEAHRRGKP